MENPLDYKINSLNKIAPKKGRVLLSEPFMVDPYFSKSVVLITEHNKDGAIGFILNKPLKQTINEIITGLPEFNATIYIGGPVNTDSLFYIHNQGEFIEESREIGNGLYWSGNFDKLKELIINQQIFPNEIKFFIGYSGWDFNQLNNEIEKEKSWIVTEIKYKTINDLNNIHIWKDMMQKMGGNYAEISNFPEDPSLN